MGTYDPFHRRTAQGLRAKVRFFLDDADRYLTECDKALRHQRWCRAVDTAGKALTSLDEAVILIAGLADEKASGAHEEIGLNRSPGSDETLAYELVKRISRVRSMTFRTRCLLHARLYGDALHQCEKSLYAWEWYCGYILKRYREKDVVMFFRTEGEPYESTSRQRDTTEPAKEKGGGKDCKGLAVVLGCMAAGCCLPVTAAVIRYLEGTATGLEVMAMFLIGLAVFGIGGSAACIMHM